MSKIYNEEVIAELETNLFYRDYKIVVLDNPRYDTYDFHVLTEHFDESEFNTLLLQIPKNSATIDEFDKLRLTMIVTQFALWDELYGYKGKSYTFSINVKNDCIFNEV